MIPAHRLIELHDMPDPQYYYSPLISMQTLIYFLIIISHCSAAEINLLHCVMWSDKPWNYARVVNILRQSYLFGYTNNFRSCKLFLVVLNHVETCLSESDWPHHEMSSNVAMLRWSFTVFRSTTFIGHGDFSWQSHVDRWLNRLEACDRTVTECPCLMASITCSWPTVSLSTGTGMQQYSYFLLWFNKLPICPK